MVNIFLFVALLAINVFWGGWVASELWGWFMVPLGVKTISYLQASGLSLLAYCFVGGRSTDHSNSDFESSVLNGIFKAILMPGAIYLLGLVIHYYQ